MSMPAFSSDESYPHSESGSRRRDKRSDAPVSLGLPVVPTRRPTEIRKSKSGRRRAIVLATVQLLIFVHIGVWLLSRHFGWFGGATISPVEPSEAMALTRDGIINAGAIFFLLILLSTLILGRWFCGWGCHLVLLQDLCGWIMKKFGVRPKAFRTRFLIYTPVVLVLYMYIWPLVYRFIWIPLVGENVVPWPGFSVELTTVHFWETFPGVIIGVLTLLVCGFAAVYFLGAKGFCTYGCPYGGAFAPLDKLATGRIRVTDACEHCGHCTAVCTSNVRVHEEVREYGMVVDPGCMKCLDCVSVCPNDALYFGFGRPAVAKGVAKNKKPKRNYDLALWEEIALAVILVILFWVYRGSYGTVSMLLAIGIAGVLAFVFWKTWRLFSDQSVNFLHARLRFKGQLRLPGVGFTVLAVVLLLVTLQLASVRVFDAIANHHESFVDDPIEAWLQQETPILSDQEREHAITANRYLTLSSGIGDGGIGLITSRLPSVALRRARIAILLGQWDQAEEILRQVAYSRRVNESVAKLYGRVLAKQGKEKDVWVFNEFIFESHPEFSEIASALAQFQLTQAEVDRSVETLTTAVEASPNDLRLEGQLIQVLVYRNDLEEAAQRIQTVLKNHPNSPAFWEQLAIVRARQGGEQGPAAIEAMRRMIRLQRVSPETYRRLAQLEAYFGQQQAATESLRKAEELQELLGGPIPGEAAWAHEMQLALWYLQQDEYVAYMTHLRRSLFAYLEQVINSSSNSPAQ